MWFIGDSKEPEWVVVRAARYPSKDAKRPSNWNTIAQSCARLSEIGHFAAVAFASDEASLTPGGGGPGKLWRGHAIDVTYEGLTDGLLEAS